MVKVSAAEGRRVLCHPEPPAAGTLQLPSGLPQAVPHQQILPLPHSCLQYAESQPEGPLNCLRIIMLSMAIRLTEAPP